MIFGKTEQTKIRTDPAPISLDSRGYTVWVFLIEHKKLRTYKKRVLPLGNPVPQKRQPRLLVSNSSSLDLHRKYLSICALNLWPPSIQYPLEDHIRRSHHLPLWTVRMLILTNHINHLNDNFKYCLTVLKSVNNFSTTNSLPKTTWWFITSSTTPTDVLNT